MKRIITLTTLALGLILGSTTVYAGGGCGTCVHPYSQVHPAVNTFGDGLTFALSFLFGLYGLL